MLHIKLHYIFTTIFITGTNQVCSVTNKFVPLQSGSVYVTEGERCAEVGKLMTRILASTLGTGPLACLSLFPVAEFG